mmetsp:Transcript_7766/g.11821  ORF Transcript_7766/g.11821 Transcript_7766/m.11821 type:complete len:545 (+) Transcript_7766:141-1775(+)|eukprot:CAMPEP_0195282876 /NCGR_PEP_ID=MMETSP0707-20130614/1603_1 /TAXON_ID=33640 /ORGANISM="Asterionellopsis glacialis, Strain CCMP134" /LENGTH=544 /DNA_ID=CAMNT_0040341943 /DNA_START=281 /DNA_END=1915 /DNA_ORIENTATION=+
MTTDDDEKQNVGGGGNGETSSSATPSPAVPASTPSTPALTSTTTSRTTKSSTAKDHGPQITKLRDANAKYKSLLKMAKERIQTQEDELEQLRMELKDHKNRLDHQTKEMEAQKQQMALGNNEQSPQGPQSYPSTNSLSSLSNFTSDQIVRVCQRIQQQHPHQSAHGASSSTNGSSSSTSHEHHHTSTKTEIWALFEITNIPQTEMIVGDVPLKKYKQWKSFDSENALQDFIRRDTGEPLMLPSYSLSPDQSQHIEHDAAQKVSHITEEFRRFRVRTEIQRKQSESTIRELQSNLAATATKRIEGQGVEKELHQAKIDHDLLERMKSQMEDQEEKWKSAYTIVVNENKALKSSGSEALLAAQWRQRYETLLNEKEDLETKLEMETEKADELHDHHRKLDAGKYEQKYRDLKESFRMYRKKAKEIFETQQRGGDVGLLSVSMNADSSKSDAKLSYLKNLMVNYLSSDDAVREQMEGAIATVLKFTPQELQRIEQKKAEYGYSSTANEYLSSFLEYTMAATTTTTEGADGTATTTAAATGTTTTGIQ